MEYQLVKKADKELVYYSIYHTGLESQDGADLLCDVRKRFFETGKRQKNRSNCNIAGKMVRCAYTMENGKPLKWKKLLDTQLCERVVPTADGYMIEFLDADKCLYKRIYYNVSHYILKAEFYSGNDRKNPVCTVTPSTDGARAVLVRKQNGTADVLYPFENLLDKKLTEQLNMIAGEPSIFCRTNSGSFYFCNEEEALSRQKSLEYLLEKTQEQPAASPEEELTDPAFEVNVAALDQEEIQMTEEPERITETEESTGMLPEEEIPSSDEPLVAETEPSEPEETEPEIIEVPVVHKEKAAESFFDETSEYAVEQTSCSFVENCPYENTDKLIIESGGKQYYYFGDITDDKRSGMGRTAMSDGKTAYEGGYKDDRRDGFGVYYYKSGKLCYAGSWKQNKREGLGVAFSPNDGSAFIGRWHENASVGLGASFDRDGNLVYLGKTRDGRRSGMGVTYSPEKDTFFIGRYKDGEYQGTGTQFDSDGNMLYVGGFTDNCRNGTGTSYQPDGSLEYKGQWKDNLYEGEGILYMEDGCILRGTFREGKAYGKCTLTDNIGRMIYIGSFAENVYNGTGRLFAEDGSYVEGRFVDGEPTGIFNEYDKQKHLLYCGEWSDMERSGKGIEYKNGEIIYDGSFRNSLYDGSGKLYRDGMLIYSGNFKDGKRNGYGVQYADDEIIYSGMWKDNRYEGCGMLYQDGVMRYAGCFVNGKRHGRVNEIIDGKIRKACIYADNKMTYMCEYAPEGFITYFGNMQDGIRSGMGCSYNAECEKEFEGIFKNGNPEKPMQVFYSEPEPLPECTALNDTPYAQFRYSPLCAVEMRIGSGLYTGQLKDGMPEGKGTILYSDHRYTGRFSKGVACGHGVIYFRDGSEKRGNFASGTSPDHQKLAFDQVVYYLHEE